MAENPRKSQAEKPTITCPAIDFAAYTEISSDTIESAKELQKTTIKQLTKSQQQELDNLNVVMKQIKEIINIETGDDEEMKENDDELNHLKILEKQADLFNQLITSINKNATAANAILTYNLYMQANMKSQNNINNNNSNIALNDNDQLKTFATVYDILWKIQGFTDLWPHFANLVNNSMYLQPWFWANCGYAVGFAISDIIKMIILGNIWIYKITAAQLAKIIKESIKDFNDKILYKKNLSQKAAIQIIKENDMTEIIPKDCKV